MIFNLFKSKPTLKELIPKGFVDIHSHILPGIDDGAKNVKESIELVNEMKELGFSKIIGTPHTYEGVHNNNNKSIKDSFNQLEKKINIELKIDYASEYMLDNTLLRKISNKSLLALKDKYILVEMSYLFAPNNLYEILFELQSNGYIPVLAHPERYSFLFNNYREYDKLKKAGCKFQINLLSTVGYYGLEVKRIADWLLTQYYVEFTGSDIHHIRHIHGFDKKIKIKNIERLQEIIENNNIFK